MAHDLEQFTDGTASMLSVRTVPWHQLGVVLDDAPTAHEALRIARLAEWNVHLEPVHLPDGTPVKGAYATVRTHPETGDPDVLGVVHNRYRPFQNEQLADLLDAVMEVAAEGDGPPVPIETAGSLSGGKRVFLTCRMPDNLTIDPQGVADEVALYVSFLTSHDGSSGVRALVTPVRIVCANTESAALRDNRSSWSIPHLGNYDGRTAEVRDALRLTWNYGQEFVVEAQRMMEQAYTDAEFARLTATLFPVQAGAQPFVETRALERHAELHHLFVEAPSNAGIHRTRWGAYNAVTEYVDWGRTVTGGKAMSASERRAFDAIMGKPSTVKRDAWELLTV